MTKFKSYKFENLKSSIQKKVILRYVESILDTDIFLRYNNGEEVKISISDVSEIVDGKAEKRFMRDDLICNGQSVQFHLINGFKKHFDFHRCTFDKYGNIS